VDARYSHRAPPQYRRHPRREFSRWKDASKTQARMIRNPKDELKHIQRLIKNRIKDSAALDAAEDHRPEHQ
jgi:hypothetical protein